MTGNPRTPTHPAVAAGFTLFIIGAVLSLWFADWRPIAAGTGALLVSAVWATVRPQ